MATEVPQPSASSGAAGLAGPWHYYAAVGNKAAKLTTLLELLQALQADNRRPVAICCSARDTLDSLVYELLRCRTFAVTAIHSDLTEKERELALMSFRRGALSTEAGGHSMGTAPGGFDAATGSRDRGPGGDGAGREAGAAAPSGPQEPLVCVVALTDVCLKALPKELLPVGVSLVVEFDLPPSKDVYTRRISALFGGAKERRSQRCVVIDLVEAGAIGAFRALEGFAASPVQELPVRIQDIFRQ